MLRALGRKLGVLRPCGTFEFSSPGDPRDGVFTIGGPSFTITEKGIEGPIYPSIWVELGWVPAASPEVSVAADKSQAEEGQPGAA
jgi:hypothetical protein